MTVMSGSEGANLEAVRPAVEMLGIVKRFGSVIACDNVDLRVARGEIHGLLGQNGAGKSTLMKILTGLIPPDAGSIIIDGTPTIVRDPISASELGIAMVHQHFSVIEELTVWENVTLGERSRLRERDAIRTVEEISAKYRFDVDPKATVRDLGMGQRQRVEIIKCLRRDPAILILDEPTSVLTAAESEDLFATLRHAVREEHRAVVLISHKLEEILGATDAVTIMRDGAIVANRETATMNAGALAQEMVGRDVSLQSEASALGLVQVSTGDTAPEPTERCTALRLTGVSVAARDGRVLLDSLDLEVREGEILGLAGVEGNGQSTLANVLSGLVAVDSGSVSVDGQRVRTGRAGAMARAGIAVIPEDRHRTGCILDMSVAENLVLDDLDRVCRGALVVRSRLCRHAVDLMDRFDIRAPTPDTPMRHLSGGNQQRVVLARVLSGRPRVLVAAQATRGLDVGAIEYITEHLCAAAERGVAVLLISSELGEILTLSDRVAVICAGRIVGTLDRSEVEPERIGLMMGGKAS